MIPRFSSNDGQMEAFRKAFFQKSATAPAANPKPTRYRKSGGNAAKSSSSSWMPSIVFWSFCIVAQYYMLSMYNNIVFLNNSSETGANSSGSQYPGLEHPRKSSARKQTTQSKFNLETADGTFNGYPIYKLKHQPTKQQQQQQQQQPGSNNNNKINAMEELYSQFQCVGETWQDAERHKRSNTYHEQSWMFRSCRFQVMCYDTSTQDYVIYLDPEKHQDSHKDHHYHHPGEKTNDNASATNPHPSPHIQRILDKQKKQFQREQKQIANEKHDRTTTTDFKHPTFIDDTSTVYRNHTIVVNSKGEVSIGDTERGKHYGVSIGSVNGKWGLVDIQQLKWFPEVRWGPVPGTSDNMKNKNENNSNKNTNSNDKNYEVYTLPPSVAMIPFHSLSASNPGHLVWDDFLPIYTLLDMFGFLKKKDASGKTSYSETNHKEDTSDWVDLLPIRYELPGISRGLWAGCDWTEEKKADCTHMLAKFGILLGTRRSYQKFHGKSDIQNTIMVENPNGIKNPRSAAKLPRIPITTNRAVELALKSSNSIEELLRNPKLICAKNGMAGFGAISDHLPGMGHGWQKWDYLNSYNSGRGGQLWEFRNYMVHNIFESLPKKKKESRHTMRRRLSYNVDTIKGQETRPSILLGKEQISTYPPSSITDAGPDEPLVVHYSAYSSQRRGGSMRPEAIRIKRAIEDSGGAFPFLYGRAPFPGEIGANVEIVVEVHVFSKYTVEEQIQMASRAAVFATYCGGGAITGSFLPKGGALHLYYSEDGGIESNHGTGLPAYLDWDFFNHCGYLHVKWLPYGASTSNTEVDNPDGSGYTNQAMANVDLIRDDLRRIHSERVQHSQHQ